MKIKLTIVAVILSVSFTFAEHKLDVTSGCHKYSGKAKGYKKAHPYFETATFKHIVTRPDNVTVLRVGMIGRKDGHIRLAPKQKPYRKTLMHEIGFGSGPKKNTVARRYIRKTPSTYSNLKILKRVPGNNMLTVHHPLMLQLLFHPGGRVEIRKDGEEKPHMEFLDQQLSFAYMGFAAMKRSVVFYYDCPMQSSNTTTSFDKPDIPSHSTNLDNSTLPHNPENLHNSTLPQNAENTHNSTNLL
ncbi:uncharacterized protein LOC129743871 [Uranotaenia lowii]|uniref:uncharacterized protein LOC129743871 n=1 Tax=Uranotaenia lowii TaxID=190385 RepID=UPI00247A1277|nr:uncharacterized protein LOC129743871 [Uranotaenia lowii]